MTQHPQIPPRGPECPAPAVLEAMSAGERAGADVERHVPSCDACRGYVAALREASETYVKARPPELLLRKLERREAERPKRAWWRWLVAAVPVAAAAVLALVVLPGGGDEDGVRLKGQGGLRVAAISKADPAPRLLGPDSRVAAGDTLRFAWEGARDGHLLVLERDGTGSTSVFWPYDAERSAKVAADTRDFLEGTVELDDAPGPEWIVAVFSPTPVEARPLVEQLRTSPADAPAVTCAGCTVRVLRLLKDR